MRIKNGYKLVNMHGQSTVVCEGNASAALENTIVLTETAAFLWHMLENGNPTKKEMLDALLNSFEISTVLALGDIDVFLRTMRENGIIEENE